MVSLYSKNDFLEGRNMKKLKLLFVLLIAFVLTACGTAEDENSASENEDTSQVETENGSDDTQTNSEEDETTTDEVTEDVELYEIELKNENNTIELKKEGEDTVVLSDQYPSEPVKSPNGQYAAYLAPFEWEELSDLYIVDLKAGSQKMLIEGNSESKPKNVIWENDEHVLVILGYPYGTVSIGGNIYRVNIETGNQEQLTEYDDATQITDFHIEDGTLQYSGIKYTDEEMNEHEEYSNQISLE